MPKHPSTINLDDFKGINNLSRPENTDPSFLKEAVNIDISKDGSVHKRLGFSEVFTGTNSHSIWSNNTDCYFVDGDVLKYLYSNFTTTNIKTDCYDRIDYVELNGDVYFTSLSTTGILNGSAYRQFGIDAPAGQPVLTEGSGFLVEGRYQVAISYVDADGRESGTTLAGVIDVSDDSSITLSNLKSSDNADVIYTRIYITTANGETLYYLGDTSDTTSSYIIGDVSHIITPLDNLGIVSAPKGDLIAYYNGRIYIAVGNVIYASQPYSYEWFRISEDFLMFESDVTMMMPVETGMYVGDSNKLYYLGGNDISTFKMVEKEMCQPVMYSNVKIPSGYIRIDNTPLGPKWLFTANEGIYVCMNQGVMFNVTADNVAFPSSYEGSAAFIQQDGINKYVSLLKDQNTDGQNAAIGDLVTADIVRNGIVLD